MIIDENKELFGFQPYEFITFLKGISITSDYKYKNKFICDILNYEEKGHYYHYEDEDVILYSPTEITKKSTFFFELKNKFLLTENENFWFYTNFPTIDKEKLEIIMIEAVSKNTKNSYNWTYCTMDYLVKTMNVISKDSYFQYYPTHIAFVLNRFFVLKNILKSDIIDKIQSLQTEEDIISGFYN